MYQSLRRKYPPNSLFNDDETSFWPRPKDMRITTMQKEMLFYYCNPTDDMQITIYTQKPGHDCWSWEAIYKGGSAFASRS